MSASIASDDAGEWYDIRRGNARARQVAGQHTTICTSNRPRLRGMIAGHSWSVSTKSEVPIKGAQRRSSGRSVSTTTSSHPSTGLVIDGVPLAEIAAGAGTPCYVYSATAIRAAYARLDTAFGAYPHAIHYALKANSTLGIVRLLKELGSGVDANSMGEVDVALRCGFRPEQVVFTGVGKSAEELDRAVALGFMAIN